MRVLFAGTPEFSVPALEALLQNHQLVGVYTQPDRKAGRGKKLTAPPVKQLAQKHGLPVFQPSTLKPLEGQQSEEQRIRELAPDVMVVVAYGMILPKSILDLPKYGCINIHASILPRWRGAAPIQRAIEAGDQETGVSIMQMAEGLDTGAVFKILKTPIDQNDTSLTLHDRLATLGAKGIISTLDDLQNDPAVGAVEQDHDLACYAKKLNKSEGQIDWSLKAKDIANRIRAFNPWPVCYSEYNGERVRILHAKAQLAEAVEGKPDQIGQVISADANGILVQTKDGAVLLTKLQRQGGKALDAKDFLQGFAISPGDYLRTEQTN